MKYAVLYNNEKWGFVKNTGQYYYQLYTERNINYNLKTIRFMLKRHRKQWPEGKDNTNIVLL